MLGTQKSSGMLASIKSELDQHIKETLSNILAKFSTIVDKNHFVINILLSCYPDISKELIYSVKLNTKVNNIKYEIDFPNENGEIPLGLFKESEYFSYIDRVINNFKNEKVIFSVSEYSFTDPERINLFHKTKNWFWSIMDKKETPLEQFIFFIDDYLKPIKFSKAGHLSSIEFLFNETLLSYRVVILPKGKTYSRSEYINLTKSNSTIEYDKILCETSIINLLVKCEILDEICLTIDLHEHKLDDMLEITKVIKY